MNLPPAVAICRPYLPTDSRVSLPPYPAPCRVCAPPPTARSGGDVTKVTMESPVVGNTKPLS